MISPNGHEQRKTENVLVTGGGGFLGGALVRRLVAGGDRVRSFSRGVYPDLDHLGVEQYRGDLSDLSTVSRACDGVETVFHVAAKAPPWGKYNDYYRTNVTGTRNIISACQDSGVKRLIYTSSPSVIFNGQDMAGVDESTPYPIKFATHYSETKAIAEQEVVTASRKALLTISLRPHEIWGPGDNHIAPRLIARAKRLKQIGNGKNLIDTIYIDNAVDAHILAAEKLKENPSLSGRIYFISQGEPVLAWEMIDAILRAAGLSPVKGKIPYRIAWLVGGILELAYRLLSLPGEPYITRFTAYAVASSHWFNISAAEKDLGYTPRIGMDEGLLKLEDWLKYYYLKEKRNDLN